MRHFEFGRGSWRSEMRGRSLANAARHYSSHGLATTLRHAAPSLKAKYFATRLLLDLIDFLGI